MGLFDFFKAKPPRIGEELYAALVTQARTPAFYTDLGVPDTVDGRFDLIILHATLVIRRLRSAGPEAQEAAQTLLNTLFGDMDVNLREMGIGDMSVGKHVKRMASAFYGRAEAYETALDDGQDASLEATLKDFIFRKGAPADETVARLAAYVRAADQQLAALSTDHLMATNLEFPAP